MKSERGERTAPPPSQPLKGPVALDPAKKIAFKMTKKEVIMP